MRRAQIASICPGTSPPRGQHSLGDGQPRIPGHASLQYVTLRLGISAVREANICLSPALRRLLSSPSHAPVAAQSLREGYRDAIHWPSSKAQRAVRSTKKRENPWSRTQRGETRAHGRIAGKRNGAGSTVRKSLDSHTGIDSEPSQHTPQDAQSGSVRGYRPGPHPFLGGHEVVPCREAREEIHSLQLDRPSAFAMKLYRSQRVTCRFRLPLAQEQLFPHRRTRRGVSTRRCPCVQNRRTNAHGMPSQFQAPGSASADKTVEPFPWVRKPRRVPDTRSLTMHSPSPCVLPSPRVRSRLVCAWSPAPSLVRSRRRHRGAG